MCIGVLDFSHSQHQPTNKHAHTNNNQDRHVLLSCFKLEGILQQRLYSQVLTLVDLRNEVNMDLLRQRVRPLAQAQPPPRYHHHHATTTTTAAPPKVPFAAAFPLPSQPQHVAVNLAAAAAPHPHNSSSTGGGSTA